MNRIEFDLQLFAEDAADTGADTGTDAVVDKSVDMSVDMSVDNEDATKDGTDGAQQSPDVAIMTDPETGRRVLVTPPLQEAEPEEQQDDAPAAYTEGELIDAMTTGSVDEARIPAHLRANYIAIRQQQQIAAMQAEKQQLETAAAQQPVRTDAPVQQAAEVSQADIYGKVQQAAEEKALKDLGIASKDDIEEMLYSDDPAEVEKAKSYQVAVQMNVMQLVQRVSDYQRMALDEQAKSAQVIQKLQSIYQQMVAEEPKFAEIDAMMGDHYKSFKYEKALKVKAAIDRFRANRPLEEDIPTLQEYYKETRAAYYAKKTGVSTTPQAAPQRQAPPHVERAGATASQTQEKIDWRSMRRMDARERSEFLRSHLS